MSKQILKKFILETISTDASYKAQIKSLFEQFPLKFSASYMQYREYNYPSAWTVKSLSHAEDFRHQHIKLLYNKNKYTDYALIFEHEGSIYVVNDNTLPFALALPLATGVALPYWHEHNYLFKLSVSDFETALDVADNYDEFITLCEQMNQEL